MWHQKNRNFKFHQPPLFAVICWLQRWGKKNQSITSIPTCEYKEQFFIVQPRLKTMPVCQSLDLTDCQMTSRKEPEVSAGIFSVIMYVCVVLGFDKCGYNMGSHLMQMGIYVYILMSQPQGLALAECTIGHCCKSR